MESSNLELYDIELLKEFPQRNITSVVDYNDHVITGDSLGNIITFKREKTKLVQIHQIQLKSKIENLIIMENMNILLVLSGGNIFIYELLSFKDNSPKDSDKESKDLKDIYKIAVNKNPQNENEILIVTKKKKLLFFYYNNEMLRLFPSEFNDKEGKPLTFNLDELPEKIMWYEKNICYYTKSGKLAFLIIKKIDNYWTKRENIQDFPVENFAYVNKSWIILQVGIGLYYDLEGQPMTKNTLVFCKDKDDPLIVDIEILNDFHIIALSEKNIMIFENNEGQLMQTLDIDTPEFIKKFLLLGKNKVFAITTNKKDEKSKDFIYKLWEVREFTFEKQIKMALKSQEIEKAFNLLNNKLEFNEEKFKFLESIYCDCGWICINRKTEEGYKLAESYFGLCNFNPFELIYHFIKLLKIKPIHEGYGDENKLPVEANNCQIISKEGSLDKNTRAALEMLIKLLQTKKTYIMKKNQLSNVLKEKGKKKSFESIKNNILTFESSQNCLINLQDVQPTDIKLFETIYIINEALVNAMALLEYGISYIAEIIEDDKRTKSFSEEFLRSINTFTSNMALACIYRKNKKYSEAINLLEPFIDNKENSEKNNEAVNLLKKILIEFGTNNEYVNLFEKGIKILLKNHSNIAFDIILYNELIGIDDVLMKILPESEDVDLINKREMFLKVICNDKNYSNGKYQILYIELLIQKLFAQVENKDIPKNKDEEKKFPKEYEDLKQIVKKFDKFDPAPILALVQNTWMYDIELYILSDAKKNDEAIQLLINLVKSNVKSFEDIREFCKINYSIDVDIFRKYFKKLREQYDDKDNQETKDMFKKEMLKIIDLFISGELLDKEEVKKKTKLELINILNPKEIISLIPSDWKLNEPLDDTQKDKENCKTIFNLMHFYLKEYSILTNNYKRLENLAKMDLTYKQKQLFELRDKHVTLDVTSCCYLCGKKIVNNTQLLIYPNGHIYHAKCSPDLSLEIKTGKNFKNFDY
jgi:hypothetical protein